MEKILAESNSVPAKLFAFTLSSQQREIATIPDVKIPASSQIVAVTLKLESDDFPAYQAVLKDSATDKILWQSDAEKSINKTVMVKFSAKILKAKDYNIEIYGISKSGHREAISGYPFHVLLQ